MNELEELNQEIRQFAVERDWEKFHTPKNLSMAIAGEVGELMECFQWLTPEESLTLAGTDKQHVAEEIADITVYLMRLCQVMEIDIMDAMRSKIKLNRAKYPVEKSRGKATKYTDLK